MSNDESHPMNGGDGAYSYAKNSDLQRAAASVADIKIREVSTEKLDVKKLSSASNTLSITDLGCSVAPNTFFSMHNVLEAVKHKFQIQGAAASKMPEFCVFYNDHVSNDFNALFASLPPERQYFAAGVPGSFYTRLFPQSSLHFVHSSYALHWLSKVPDEVLDKSSSAWNKGRIYYGNATEDVHNAYAAQFGKDTEIFLDARAEEIVVGGMMVLLMPSVPGGIPQSSVLFALMFDLLGSSLMDMAKEEIITESQVDSFNLPIYVPFPMEMKEIIERHGYFSIERLESTNASSETNIQHAQTNIQPAARLNTLHLRAGLEGIFSKHFIDELFDRFFTKLVEHPYLLDRSNGAETQLFIVLTRK